MGPSPPTSTPAGAAGRPGLHPGFGTSARLWLLRHAEVHEDFQGVAYGSLDVPLSAEGEAETVRLGAEFGRLPLAAIATSPLARARLLAEGLARHAGLELREERALAEIHRGSWQGQLVSDLPAAAVEAFYEDPWTFDGHGGENDAQVLVRAWPVVADLVQAWPGRDVAVVAHYNVIRMIVAHALGVPARSSFSLRLDPGRAILLEDARVEPGESRTEVPLVSGWMLRHANLDALPARLAAEGVAR